jgi:hypothetical protein
MTQREHEGAGPDLALLADWIEGRLDPVTEAEVAAAVEHGSRAVKDSTEWVRTFIQNADVDPLPVPPPLIRQRLRQSYRDWCEGRDGRSPASGPAILVFDSRVDRATRAVRGAADRNAIHLAYRAERAELVLDVRMLGDGYARVDGQVFPNDETDAPVFEVVATGREVVFRVVDGDQLGRFRIAPMPLDRYDLAVSNGEFTVSAPLDLCAH